MSEYEKAHGNYEMNCLLNDIQKKISSVISEAKRIGFKEGDAIFDKIKKIDSFLDLAIDKTDCKGSEVDEQSEYKYEFEK